MRPFVWFAVAVAGLAEMAAVPQTAGSGQVSRPLAAAEVLTRVDKALFPGAFTMDLKLTDHKPRSGDRVFRIHLQGIRRTGSLLSFSAPPTEVGKRYLFRDRSIWISVPGLPNVVRVSAKEGFLDSSFTNTDLMDAAYGDDYDSLVESMPVVDGRQIYVLACKAKNARITYASIRMQVDAETFLPRQLEYFTRSGLRMKVARFTDVKRLAGRQRPGRIEMREESVADSYSVIEIDRMDETEIRPDALSVEALR